MFNFDFSVHALWGGPTDMEWHHYISVVGPPKTALYARQTTTVDQKNVKIENAVETMTPTSWMPLR